MTESLILEVKWTSIKVIQNNETDYISLTDIAKFKNAQFPADIVKNWLRNKNTIAFLGIWEQLYNPIFNMVEFDQFKKEAGLNAFVLSPQKWIESTHAIWLISKSWKYGWGTFAHKDIALEFANRISVEFRLYFIKEFQRLKQEETKSLDWNVKRFLTKVNYKIHTDSIQEHLIPKELSQVEINFIYADEADVLNKALFGMTAKQWRENNNSKKWNIRDDATIEQLIVLANIESMNAQFIKMNISQSERLQILNQTAITQMKSLLSINVKKNITEKL